MCLIHASIHRRSFFFVRIKKKPTKQWENTGVFQKAEDKVYAHICVCTHSLESSIPRNRANTQYNPCLESSFVYISLYRIPYNIPPYYCQSVLKVKQTRKKREFGIAGSQGWWESSNLISTCFDIHSMRLVAGIALFSLSRPFLLRFPAPHPSWNKIMPS